MMKYTVLIVLLIALLVNANVNVQVNVNSGTHIRHRFKPNHKPIHNQAITVTPANNEVNLDEADLDEATTITDRISNFASNLMKKAAPTPFFSYFQVVFDDKIKGTPVDGYSAKNGRQRGYTIPFAHPYKKVDLYILCQNADDLVMITHGDRNSPDRASFASEFNEGLYTNGPYSQRGLPYAIEKPAPGSIPAKFNQASYRITLVSPDNTYYQAYTKDVGFTVACKAQVGSREIYGMVVLHPAEKK